MKKFIMFIGIYLVFLSIPLSPEIKADSGIIKYQLYMDSNSNDFLKTKETVTTILDYICDGVQEDSYATMINANLSLFKKIENSNIKFKQGALIIKIGDGKGSFINGVYEKHEMCLEEVKPKSKVMEWLGME